MPALEQLAQGTPLVVTLHRIFLLRQAEHAFDALVWSCGMIVCDHCNKTLLMLAKVKY
jgi:hypothetical protein